MAQKRKVLITGAAGNIGSYLAHDFADDYDLVLTDARQAGASDSMQVTVSNLTDLDAMRRLCQGVDTVVHLAADPSTEATWESLLPNNMIGVYHALEAAALEGCRRLIFASSVNAVAAYPSDVQIQTAMPVRPANLYGASKAWGEAAASHYADQRGLACICLRFGWVLRDKEDLPKVDPEAISMVITLADLARLVRASIEAPDTLRFGIFHGLSNNRWKRMDIEDARRLLGYAPQDDAFVMAGIVDAA